MDYNYIESPPRSWPYETVLAQRIATASISANVLIKPVIACPYYVILTDKEGVEIGRVNMTEEQFEKFYEEATRMREAWKGRTR